MVELLGVAKLMDDNIILKLGTQMNEAVIEIEIADFRARPPAGTLIANGHPFIHKDMSDLGIMTTKIRQPIRNYATSDFFMCHIVATGQYTMR